MKRTGKGWKRFPPVPLAEAAASRTGSGRAPWSLGPLGLARFLFPSHMRLPAFALAFALVASGCGEADAPADSPSPDASTTEIADAVTPVDSPEETAELDADPLDESDAAADAPAEAPASTAADENDVREAVYGFLVESVMDGPQPPELEAWDDAVNIEGMAGYYVGMPAMAGDVEAFESFCGGIASAIAPGEGGIVRAYLRRGTAGGWTVIDSEVCYSDGSWETWQEEYSLPEGLVVEAP